uniref:Prolycopene isomerase n=1 Tax=Cyanophora paradoxa TaxID=2762 RepID=A0A2D2AH01_CYAPA|nr:prolycopene isomerase [Cyanophora paradoxa]
MIFGFGEKGTTNLLTRALALVGEKLETIPDPVQIDYHLPNALDVQVHRDYEKFIGELAGRFPHEAAGIRAFYDECWAVFNCLNAMDLLSLEEPRYLARVFFEHPLACLGLVKYLPLNVGGIARKHIRDEELLRFIDMECYCWSVVPAEKTPMINAGMVFSDRHYGGINYPRGGVGKIAAALARGIERTGLGRLRYRSRVTRVLLEGGTAVGVELADGRQIRGKRIVSNATRWDTFGKLLPEERTPITEKWWRGRYEKSPSFLSMHLGVRADALPAGTECHHILLEEWSRLEATDGTGTLFVSIPTLLDPSLAPPGRHIVHAFAPAVVEDFQKMSPAEYEAAKEAFAGRLIARLERIFPGLGAAVEFKEVGSPRTHRRYLGRADGTYGPIPSKVLPGLLTMPFNRTPIRNLYTVGDSTFPGQGLNAVAFSGFACGWRIAADLGKISLLGR